MNAEAYNVNVEAYNVMTMMMRSVPRLPFILCSKLTNLSHFSQSFPSKSLPCRAHGINRFRSRIGKSKEKYIINCIGSSRRRAMSTVGKAPPLLSGDELLLKGLDDDHGGVIVEMTNMPMDPAVFASLLRTSLSHWTQQGKKGIWMKLPIEHVNLVEPAVKEGFYFHHAEPKYLMLVRWIPETINTLPANASHRVGIGAFVMNHNKEVLVVQEKSGILRGTGVWKFPTGVVDGGEDICDAAVREVKEETGVEANFVEVLAFRQSHKSFFEKSDLFFVCQLEPLSFDIQTQESEIEAAQWMPFEEYAAQQFVQKNELLRYITDICLAKRDGSYSGFSTVPTTTSFSDNKSYLYLNRESLNNL